MYNHLLSVSRMAYFFARRRMLRCSVLFLENSATNEGGCDGMPEVKLQVGISDLFVRNANIVEGLGRGAMTEHLLQQQELPRIIPGD